MPTLFASKFQRVSATLSDGTSFNDVRALSSGTQKGTITTSFNSVVQVIKDAGRGSGTFRIRRAFLTFDTSDINNNVSVATLNLKVAFSNPDLEKIAIVRGTATGEDLDDFDAITGFNPNASMTGNVTDLANVPAHDFSTNSLNDDVAITLNSTARGLMTSENTLTLVLVSHEYDYLRVEPSSNGFFDVGLYGITNTNTALNVNISYTEIIPPDPYIFMGNGKYTISSGKISI